MQYSHLNANSVKIVTARPNSERDAPTIEITESANSVAANTMISFDCTGEVLYRDSLLSCVIVLVLAEDLTNLCHIRHMLSQ